LWNVCGTFLLYCFDITTGESHREVSGPMRVVLKRLEERLSEPTIRVIKAPEELHKVPVIR
jgi:hypothetical protein